MSKLSQRVTINSRTLISEPLIIFRHGESRSSGDFFIQQTDDPEPKGFHSHPRFPRRTRFDFMYYILYITTGRRPVFSSDR